MGISFSMFFKKKLRIIMVGLDNSGKTTILYKLKFNSKVETIPTIGFNIETVKYKNLELTVWDLGGQDKLRTLWKYYYENSDVLIFVIDSCDIERMKEANQELYKILVNESSMNFKCILFYWNKIDSEKSLNVKKFYEYFDTSKTNCKKILQPCSAVTANGLAEGLEKLSKVL